MDEQGSAGVPPSATEDSAQEVARTEESNTDETADVKTAGKKHGPMPVLLAESAARPAEGDIVEGAVSALGRARVYVDLPPWGSGLIFGREYLNARDILRKVQLGDTIAAKVIASEGEDGYIELSLREARQALIWSEAEAALARQTVLSVQVTEANKGGLILSWQGIPGFLPASQLAAEHYPRVEDGDKDKIYTELQKLVGEYLNVVIITADQKEGRLIFSEKGPQEKEEKEEKMSRYAVGDVVGGEITGAVDFGVFVKLEEGLEGLVHISELDWGLVEDTRLRYKIGEKVRVKVIEVKDDKISLSIKQLTENPWVAAAKKYTKGQTAQGVIIKYNKHGALASIEEGVAGLVHISEFASEQELRDTLELGKVYPLKITLFEPQSQRMTLSYKEAIAEQK